jgi:hypothetical protein
LEEGIKIITQLKEAMRSVIRSGGASSLFDTPYTSMVPFLLREIPGITGTQPILVLTERDPLQWVNSRFEDGKHFLIHCRTIFYPEEARDEQTLPAALRNDDEEKGISDPFDFETCLKKAIFEQHGMHVVDNKRKETREGGLNVFGGDDSRV